MSETHVILKKFQLKNNCPECYSNDGLELVFKQTHKETSLYTSITKAIHHDLHCKTCDTPVFPIMWTQDIERVFEYHQKGVHPEKSSIRLKKKGWLWLAIILCALIASLVIGLSIDRIWPE